MFWMFLWSHAVSIEFVLSDGMKNLTIKSIIGNEILTQEAVLANSSINLLENVVIEEGIVAVKQRSFYQFNKLKRAYLSGDVKIVESNVFEECRSLMEVEFSEGLETIGSRIFYNCLKLEIVTIPSTLKTKFQAYDFCGCSSLKSFKVSKNSPIYSASDDESVLMYGSVALVGPGAYKAVTIPDNAQSIANSFLFGRWSVSKVIFSKTENLKRIEEYAFRQTSISELIMPAGLEYLDGAPVLDSSLKKLFFPKSLQYVGNVFANVPEEYEIEEGCKAIIEEEGVLYDGNKTRILLLSGKATSLNITKSIKELNIEQFRTCELLSKLTVEDNHEVYWEFGNVLYAANKTTLISCPGGVRNVTVWKGCKEVANSAFKSSFISEIHFEDSEITKIGASVFHSCKNINHITLPKKLSQMLWHTFYGCSVKTVVVHSALSSVDTYLFATSSITSLNLSRCNNLKTLATKMFESCTSLTSIELPPKLTTISANCFKGCTSLTSISFPSTIATINDAAFQNCKSLSTILIEDGMVNLNKLAQQSFSGCNFTVVRIPACVHTLSQGCFSDNPNLKEVVFEENSVTSIEAEVFKGCPMIKSIELPKSLTSISFGGLSQMYGLVEISVKESNENFKAIEGILFDKSGRKLVVFPGGLERYEVSAEIESIGEKAFMKCIKLKELNFSANARIGAIGSYTFSGCSGLVSITIPCSVSTMESFSFSECISPESVVFENGSLLENLESDTFSGCVKLNEVLFNEGSLREVGERVFKSCPRLKVFDAGSVKVFRESAFEDCVQLESISLLEAQQIEANCFRGCKALRKIRLTQNLEFLGTDSFRGCDRIRWIEYCGNQIFKSDSFLGVEAQIAVLVNYTSEMLGGIGVWKVLDEGCNMPTHRFTQGDNLEIETNWIVMTNVFLHADE